MAEYNWGAYYQRLRQEAQSFQLPNYVEGQAVDANELARISIKVQQVRDWFTDAHATAQEHLQEARRKLIHIKHVRKVKYNQHMATNSGVLKLKTREQRISMVLCICADEDTMIAELESVISDWEAAVSTIEEYLKAVETAKVTLGRIQRMMIAELENLR